MRKTSLPGFTAELSLHQAGVQHRTRETDGVRKFGQQVEPQLPPRLLSCYLNCLGSVGGEEGWSDLCAYACTHGGL